MPINTMDLNDVRMFAAASQAGTLTAAAKVLGVPPSTVSRSLTRIEKHLGLCLVRRGPKGLTLTDPGREYLRSCKIALRALAEGAEGLEDQRSHPKGVLKVACPITMARDLLAPLLNQFFVQFPDVRVQIDPYCSDFEQEPREDVDVFFKIREPKDSLRRIRPFPSTLRGLFASPDYVRKFGSSTTPDGLSEHRCIGKGIWKLKRGKTIATPNIPFRVLASDPNVHLTLGLAGVGICLLPLWMAKRPENRDRLIAVLPQWQFDPLTLCALFSVQARLSPKVQALLDFLLDYIGTARDPRLHQTEAKECFTRPS